jgi:hypothetical protein
MTTPGSSAPPWPLHNAAALCSAVASGDLDPELSELIVAINARTKAIAAQRTAAALSRLHLNQRVRLNQRVKPAYLRGETGTVHEFYGDDVVVLLDRVVGRFSSRHVRCAPEVVELVADT